MTFRKKCPPLVGVQGAAGSGKTALAAQLLWLALGTPPTMAHIRQSRPDSGRGFQVQVLFRQKLFPLRSRAKTAPRWWGFKARQVRARPRLPPSSSGSPSVPPECIVIQKGWIKQLQDFGVLVSSSRDSRFNPRYRCYTIPLLSEYGTHKTVESLAFRYRSLKTFKLFPLRSRVEGRFQQAGFRSSLEHGCTFQSLIHPASVRHGRPETGLLKRPLSFRLPE